MLEFSQGLLSICAQLGSENCLYTCGMMSKIEYLLRLKSDCHWNLLLYIMNINSSSECFTESKNEFMSRNKYLKVTMPLTLLHCRPFVCSAHSELPHLSVLISCPPSLIHFLEKSYLQVPSSRDSTENISIMLCSVMMAREFNSSSKSLFTYWHNMTVLLLILSRCLSNKVLESLNSRIIWCSCMR
jgi:hypothetical protein